MRAGQDEAHLRRMRTCMLRRAGAREHSVAGLLPDVGPRAEALRLCGQRALPPQVAGLARVQWHVWGGMRWGACACTSMCWHTKGGRPPGLTRAGWVCEQRCICLYSAPQRPCRRVCWTFPLNMRVHLTRLCPGRWQHSCLSVCLCQPTQ